MRAILIFLAATMAAPSISAQVADANSTSPARPLPDIPALMHAVEVNQRKAEAVEKDYIYHSVTTRQQADSHGGVKKTAIIEADNFWLNGVPITRIVKRDGKALNADELAKEDKKLDEIAAKARDRRAKADSSGKESDPHGEDEVTVSRLLELGAFTNPRRTQIDGRDTIAVDFGGDPKAKTRNSMEDVLRDLAGTVWVDEQDRMLVRVEGRFVNSFKIGAGLVVNIRGGTHFKWQLAKINDEVWLPAMIDAEGAARILLFRSFDGRLHVTYSDYRKFRATSTVLPATAMPAPADSPASPPASRP